MAESMNRSAACSGGHPNVWQATQAADAVGVAGGVGESDCAAQVVQDQSDVVQPQPVDDRVEHVGVCGDAYPVAGGSAGKSGAGKIQRDAAECRAELVDDVAPDERPHARLHEEDRGSRADVDVVDGVVADAQEPAGQRPFIGRQPCGRR
jgi:hypothetical protein